MSLVLSNQPKKVFNLVKSNKISYKTEKVWSLKRLKTEVQKNRRKNNTKDDYKRMKQFLFLIQSITLSTLKTQVVKSFNGLLFLKVQAKAN